MALKISYLCTRSGRLYFRRRIPNELHRLAGQREWKISLGLRVGQEKEATSRIIDLVDQTDKILIKLEQGIPAKLAPKRASTHSEGELLTLSEAFDCYVRQKDTQRVGKAERTAFDQLVAHIGDRPLSDIDRAAVRDWIRSLRHERGQSAQTVRRRIGSAKAIFNNAIDMFDLPFRNPFARQKVGDQNPLKRLPFHKSQLDLIASWVHQAKDDSPTALIIKLLKDTGCRPLEIGGLTVNDVDLLSKTPTLVLRPNSRRQLKTTSSERTVPLCGAAVDAAATAASASDDGWLFPASCSKTELLSARLNKAIRAAGVPKSPALTAYSFRHTFVEAMRRARVRPEIQRVLIGHQRVSMTDHYGAHTYDIEELMEAVNATLPRLGEVSIQQYEDCNAKTVSD